MTWKLIILNPFQYGLAINKTFRVLCLVIKRRCLIKLLLKWKKVLAIPMKSLNEQRNNTAALKEPGVPVINKKNLHIIQEWMESDYCNKIESFDVTREAFKRILEIHIGETKKSGKFQQISV